MTSRHSRPTAPGPAVRGPVAPLHSGPGAMQAAMHDYMMANIDAGQPEFGTVLREKTSMVNPRMIAPLFAAVFLRRGFGRR